MAERLVKCHWEVRILRKCHCILIVVFFLSLSTNKGVTPREADTSSVLALLVTWHNFIGWKHLGICLFFFLFFPHILFAGGCPINKSSQTEYKCKIIHLILKQIFRFLRNKKKKFKLYIQN